MKRGLVLIGSMMCIVWCATRCMAEEIEPILLDRAEVVFFTLSLLEGRPELPAGGAVVTVAPEEGRAFVDSFEQEVSGAMKENQGAGGVLTRLNKMTDFSTRVMTEYNDNIYSLHTDQIADTKTTITQVCSIGSASSKKQASKRFQWSARVGADINRWLDNPNNDRENPFGELYVTLPLFSKCSLKGLMHYDRGQATSTFIEETATRGFLIDFDNLSSRFFFDMELNKVSFETGVATYSMFYDQEPYKVNNSYSQTQYFLTGYWKLAPKTKLFLEYDQSTQEYTKAETTTKNSDARVYWAGIVGKISPKISGLAKIGYQTVDYVSGTGTNTNTLLVNLDYKRSRTLKFNLQAQTQSASSASSGESTSDVSTWRVSANYLPPFNKKLEFGLSFLYINTTYTSSRVDEYYKWALTGSYLFRKWWKIRAGYELIERASTRSTLDYEQNRIFCESSMEY